MKHSRQLVTDYRLWLVPLLALLWLAVPHIVFAGDAIETSHCAWDERVGGIKCIDYAPPTKVADTSYVAEHSVDWDPDATVVTDEWQDGYSYGWCGEYVHHYESWQVNDSYGESEWEAGGWHDGCGCDWSCEKPRYTPPQRTPYIPPGRLSYAPPTTRTRYTPPASAGSNYTPPARLSYAMPESPAIDYTPPARLTYTPPADSGLNYVYPRYASYTPARQQLAYVPPTYTPYAASPQVLGATAPVRTTEVVENANTGESAEVVAQPDDSFQEGDDSRIASASDVSITAQTGFGMFGLALLPAGITGYSFWRRRRLENQVLASLES